MTMVTPVLMPDGYDMSHLDPFLERFKNPDPATPFIEPSLENSYGSLWQFKSEVEGWSLAVSRYHKFVRILHKEKNSPRYLDLSVHERLKVIEEHHGKYIVLVVGAVDRDSECDLSHVHSLVIEVGAEHAQFDGDPLIKSMIGTSCEDLILDLEKTAWKNEDGTQLSAVSFGRRLNRVFLTLTHYITDKSASKISTVPLQSSALVAVREDSAAPSRGSIQHPRASPIPAPSRSRGSKRPATDIQEASTSEKKRKQTGKAGSSGSVLTQTEETKKTKAKAKDKDVPDYQKFTEIQKTFWDDCESAYVFDMKTTFPVNVKQCHIAKDEYIVRDLEREIVK